MSIIPRQTRAGRPREGSLSAVQCALALVTGGLAVAAVMLALIACAQPAQASQLASVPEKEAQGQGSALTQSGLQEEPQSYGSVFARSPLQEEPQSEGSVFAQLQPQAGPYRQGSVFAAFYPEPDPTFTPFPQLARPFTPSGPFMPMPVNGTWVVTCGYRCGLHTEANNLTYALDIVPVQGVAAAEPVRSPVDGRITVVVDAATFFCNGAWRYGPEGGSVIVIDFEDAAGTSWRLRLVHLDPETVDDDLRPDGEPVPVTTGTFLGKLAPLDGCGHLHMSLSRLEEGREIPEPLVIEGTLFEDCAEDTCWEGTQLPPEAP
jgi:hypothetical protein